MKKQLFSIFENSFERVYYWWFIVHKRKRMFVNALNHRIKDAGVEMIPLTANERKKIEQRFLGYKIDWRWFEYYKTAYHVLHNDKYDFTKVVPPNIFYPYVDPYFAHPIDGLTYSDKNMSDLLLHDIKTPRTVVRYQEGVLLNENYDIISLEDAEKIMNDHDRLIVKPSHLSGAGHGIVFWHKEDGYDSIEKIFSGKTNYVVQEVVKQHPEMSKLNSSSINTLRMETLIWNGEVHLISCAMRMGSKGSRVDNLSDGGGLSVGVNLNDGSITPIGYNYYRLNVTYSESPMGYKFTDFKVPSWDKCVELVKKAAPRFARMSKLIAWDIAITADGDPIVIESNLMFSGAEILQLDNGPLFGDYTDDILKEVLNNKRKKY